LSALPDFNIIDLLSTFIVLLFSLTIHESAHAWTANWLGDPTARSLGRITLNPLVHVDPIGTVLLPLIAFSTGAPIIGWAKPVPVNVANLRNDRSDFVWVAAAGPISNLVIALAGALMMRLLAVWATNVDVLGGQPSFLSYDLAGLSGPVIRIFQLANLAVQINLLLAVFNMIPIPPLDGGNVLGGMLPMWLGEPYDRLVRPYGFLLLYALLLTGTLGAIIGPPYLFLSRLLMSVTTVY
jgi:Zn-dependent protease|tara:strand:+ start:74 stop:790 length:717 start_codon:yes stop_codon:yes gene_type:complete